jgi:hypothetical protein
MRNSFPSSWELAFEVNGVRKGVVVDAFIGPTVLGIGAALAWARRCVVVATGDAEGTVREFRGTW